MPAAIPGGEVITFQESELAPVVAGMVAEAGRLAVSRLVDYVDIRTYLQNVEDGISFCHNISLVEIGTSGPDTASRFDFSSSNGGSTTRCELVAENRPKPGRTTIDSLRADKYGRIGSLVTVEYEPSEVGPRFGLGDVVSARSATVGSALELLQRLESSAPSLPEPEVPFVVSGYDRDEIIADNRGGGAGIGAAGSRSCR